MPLYPGSGAAHETGAFGNVMNTPLDPGSDGRVMRDVYDLTIFPAIAAFKPQLILVSAGFDAHRADPLANLNWDTEDFSWLTRRICDLADIHCDGRVVSTLEGGYDLNALAESAAAHVRILMERGQ
jgi:acetoin utilization deacetylase AcuC-like enzyme